MRTIFLAILICFVAPISAQCTRTGQFEGATYSVNGTVTMTFSELGDKSVAFSSDFSTQEGPDLYVYLANTQTIDTSSGNPSGVVELDLLEFFSGASEFIVPENVAINDYAYVVIQCKAFNVAWGFAPLGGSQGSGCTGLSVATNMLDTIDFHPNPAKDKITFNTDSGTRFMVTLYNYSGLKLLEKSITPSLKDLYLNRLSSGMYFIEMRQNHSRSIKKLIVR